VAGEMDELGACRNDSNTSVLCRRTVSAAVADVDCEFLSMLSTES